MKLKSKVVRIPTEIYNMVKDVQEKREAKAGQKLRWRDTLASLIQMAVRSENGK